MGRSPVHQRACAQRYNSCAVTRVLQIEGGILKYLETVPEAESRQIELAKRRNQAQIGARYDITEKVDSAID